MRDYSKINSIVVLTGAGISAESGIRTFRDSDGLWEDHPIEDVATPEGFLRNPSLVYKFYNARRKQLLSEDIGPNRAHKALADLEKCFGEKLLLVTQNVDNLHERAGSDYVLHMHGELLKMRCQVSNQVFESLESFNETTICDCCQMPKNLRPHIVWFGELPFYISDIYRALEDCDLFLSIGTSGNVYPAAGFSQMAKQNGKSYNVEFNQEETSISNSFDKHIYGPAASTLPKFVSKLIEAKNG